MRPRFALGMLAVVALSGCAGYNTGGYGETPATAPPASAAAAPAAAPAAQAAAPVGSPTDKLIAATIPRMGKVVTDAKGWVLYRFDKDTANPPATNCSGDCAKVWPPVVVNGQPELDGVASEAVGTVTRDDGANQVTLGGWPLYRYAGDLKPGQWKGQAVGGVWFVAAPNGKKNLTCLPTVTPTPVAPPSAQGTGY